VLERSAGGHSTGEREHQLERGAGGRGTIERGSGGGGGGRVVERGSGGGGREVERGSSGDERDIFAQALELEAALAAEKAWELREAWASLSAGPELEHDSPLRGMDLDGNVRASVSPSAPNPSALDKVSLIR
jgi:hypothetical protein